LNNAPINVWAEKLKMMFCLKSEGGEKKMIIWNWMKSIWVRVGAFRTCSVPRTICNILFFILLTHFDNLSNVFLLVNIPCMERNGNGLEIFYALQRKKFFIVKLQPNFGPRFAHALLENDVFWTRSRPLGLTLRTDYGNRFLKSCISTSDEFLDSFEKNESLVIFKTKFIDFLVHIYWFLARNAVKPIGFSI